MTRFFLWLMPVLLAVPAMLFAQGDRKDKTPVTFEELYDEPSSIQKLFVQFQPMYGELFALNVNAGFGIEATYFHQNKATFKALLRKPYGSRFYDFNRDLAIGTNDMENTPITFLYSEFGFTYHIKDFEESSKTKMILYKKSYKGNTWSSRVPLNAEVPCKVRKIYGARLGGIYWQSTVGVSGILDQKKLTNNDLKDITDANVVLPLTHVNEFGVVQPLDVFSSVRNTGLYVGGSMAWIKNVAVSFDKFEEGIDDLILTAYADILVSPSVKLDNVVYNNPLEIDPLTQRSVTRTYDVSPVKTNMVGFRVGIDGKFNRTWSWAYGGEVGYRPGIQGRGFFAMLKISFPVYATNMDYKVESFGK